MSARLPLACGRIALLDESDLPSVIRFKWCAVFRCSTWYVSRSYREDGRSKGEYLHRVIMAAPLGMLVDHINGDGLDNRRKNLRLCDQSQNQGNQHRIRDGFRGVTWHKASNKWRAQICIFKKFVHLGLFESREDAAIAYDLAAMKHFGEFAQLNGAAQMRLSERGGA